jgi:RNA polymerase sigma-70 factor (ECF subfamily)
LFVIKPFPINYFHQLKSQPEQFPRATVLMNTNVQPHGQPDNDGDDAADIEQCRAGNRQAFDRIMRRYQNRIVAVCVRLTNSRSDGEDAAQDTFVKAFRGIAAFREESRFSTWLYQIAINTCRNRQRSWWNMLKRRAVRLDEPVQTDDGPITRDLPDTRYSPEIELERSRISAGVRCGLQKLSARHRELIVLRDIQGMSYEEIALATNLNPGTVKSGLARAREALQQLLKGLNDG